MSPPWWVWLAPLAIFHLGTQLSIHFSIAPGSSTWYLPIPLGIVLVLAWGPRVLPAMFLNAMVSAPLWGLERWWLAPIYAWPEVAEVFLSWVLFRYWLRADPALPDLRSGLQAMVWAFLVPITIGSLLTQGQLWLLGDLSGEEVLNVWLTGWIGDLLGASVIALPLMVSLLPTLQRWAGLPRAPIRPSPVADKSAADWTVIILIAAGLAVLAIVLPLAQWWSLIGLISVLAGVRYGMAVALFLSFWVVTWSFLIPLVTSSELSASFTARQDLLPQFAGLLLLPVTAFIVGRAVEDLARTAAELTRSQFHQSALITALPDVIYRVEADGELHRESQETATAVDDVAVASLISAMLKEAEQSGQGLLTKEVCWATGTQRLQAEVRLVCTGDVTFAVVRDVTDRHQQEERLRHAHRLEAVGQLAGGVAHDFNNMLAVILAQCHLLGESRDDPQRIQRGLETIENASQRAADLTRRLLLFARRDDIQTQHRHFHDLLSDSLTLVTSTLPSNIAVQRSLEADQDVVSVETSIMQNLLMNLFINARDAMPDGGVLNVASANDPDGTTLRCIISDNGVGMDRQTQERIFDPYFTTKQPGKGTGIGLSMALSAMHQHGGTIEVASNPGIGTTFTLTLPLATAAGSMAERSESSVPDHLAAQRILLVDDEEVVRMLLAEQLRSHGHKVQECIDGAVALDILERQGGEIDIIISDRTMPGLSGPALLADLRAGNHRQPLILMSGNLTSEDRQRVAEFGPASCINKPFTLEELLATMASVMSAPSASGA